MSWMTMQRSSSCSILAGISRSMMRSKSVLLMGVAWLRCVGGPRGGSQEKQRQVGTRGGARRRQLAQEPEQVVVLAQAPGRFAPLGGQDRRAEVRDEQGRLPVGGEL